MSKIKTHKDLDVWKEAMTLAREVYKLTKSFPKEEMYGLVPEIRRAAVSIPSNIAEGAARNSDKEFIQFLIAQAKPFSYNYSVEERIT
jgi:four helix bundle protein